jgi:hypothetical protein
MSDSKEITVKLTQAQYDIFVAAAHQADGLWKELGIARSSNRQTLLKAMDKLGKAWAIGIRS